MNVEDGLWVVLPYAPVLSWQIHICRTSYPIGKKKHLNKQSLAQWVAWSLETARELLPQQCFHLCIVIADVKVLVSSPTRSLLNTNQVLLLDNSVCWAVWAGYTEHDYSPFTPSQELQLTVHVALSLLVPIYKMWTKWLGVPTKSHTLELKSYRVLTTAGVT